MVLLEKQQLESVTVEPEVVPIQLVVKRMTNEHAEEKHSAQEYDYQEGAHGV